MGSPLQHTLQFHWPRPPGRLKLLITTQSLAFQNISLQNVVVSSASWHWFSSLFHCSVFGIDASKDGNKTSIAAIVYRNNISCAVPRLKSVFPAEASAIQMAFTYLPLEHRDIYILTDSLSVLKGLKVWSFKSPHIILCLISSFQRLSDDCHHVYLVDMMTIIGTERYRRTER